MLLTPRTKNRFDDYAGDKQINACGFYQAHMVSILKQGKRFIFTGTLGSGKTSVIMELEKLGHAIIDEAALI